jgi:predicted nucleic acid-binding Zn ribbon protein
VPTHGYRCVKCTKEYEVFYTSQSAVEREEKGEKCPESKCGSKEKKRLPPTGATFIKGKGSWYSNGYR